MEEASNSDVESSNEGLTNKEMNQGNLATGMQTIALLVEAQMNKIMHNNLEAPVYIHQLFGFKCNSIRSIHVDLAYLKTCLPLFMNDTNTMIQFNKFAQIFLRLISVNVKLPYGFAFTNTIIKHLYQDLSSQEIRKSNIFQRIEFCYQTKSIQISVRDQMTTELQDDFDNIGWIVSVQKNEENDESVYFTKIQAAVNPNYRPLAAALRIQSQHSLKLRLQRLPCIVHGQYFFFVCQQRC